MLIGLLKIEIYIPHSHSLKEKRKTVKGLKDRLKSRFNVAVAELDFTEKWQRSVIGIVTLNSDKSIVDQRLQKVISDVENTLEGDLLKIEIDYF